MRLESPEWVTREFKDAFKGHVSSRKAQSHTYCSSYSPSDPVTLRFRSTLSMFEAMLHIVGLYNYKRSAWSLLSFDKMMMGEEVVERGPVKIPGTRYSSRYTSWGNKKPYSLLLVSTLCKCLLMEGTVGFARNIYFLL